MQEESTIAYAGLNLNLATEEELARVPSIGPQRARRIVEYRRLNGRFVSARELRNIEGFAPATVEELVRTLRV